jgi:spermidine synthase/MFS family permease
VIFPPHSFARRSVPVLLFASGFCALIYQTTWLREFRLIFGASTAASAAVLGIFMAGLGFGSIILGRRSEGKTHPLAFYARLEILIAITAALTPIMIWAARHLYIAFGGTEAMGLVPGTMVRLVLAALIIGISTFLMGGTLPAAVRAVVAREDDARRSIGLLYGANTLGAVAGAMAGTFYCFENFGNRATLWMAAALNIGVALLALYLSKSMPAVPASKPAREEKSGNGPRVRPIFVLVAAGLVGFAFFLMEMVWYRMMSPILGSTTFCFGLVLAVALLGIGMGGVAYAGAKTQRPASWNFFAFTCAAEALFLALPYALGDRIAAVAMLLWPMGTLGFYGHVLAWGALCLIVVFPAAFMAGLQFPLLIALLGRGRERVGIETGAAYGWNTAGALLGSLAGGFGFMPMFSAPGVWKIATILLCTVGCAASFVGARQSRSWRVAIIPVVVVLFAVSLLWTTGPTAFWRHSQIGVGRLKNFPTSPNKMRDLIHEMRRRLLWEKDGIESSVALAKEEDGLGFIVNGRADGNAKSDAGMQVMFGLIGAALHPNPTKAMVVGLGTGSTAGWVAAVPSVRKVDVVELEPAILKVAQECGPVNHDALANRKLHVFIGDARERLLTTREKYDLIASEPSNPYRAGIAGLFTREFYESVQERLEPGGLFLQWVQAYEIDDATIQTIYRTLGSVFPNIESWQPQDGDLVLVASREPVHYDLEGLRARLAEEPFKTALPAVWRANGLEDFLAHYIANASVAKALALGSGPLNTDDRTVIEFAFARSVDLAQGFQIATLRAGAQAAQADRPQFAQAEPDWSRLEEARLAMNATYKELAQIEPLLTSPQRSRAAALASYNAGDFPTALRLWRAQSEEPKTLAEFALLADTLAAEGDSAALPYLEKLAEVLPSDAEAIRAQLLSRQGRIEEAVRRLDNFFRDIRHNPWPARELINRAILSAAPIAYADPSKLAATFLYESLRFPLCVYTNEENRLLQMVNLGVFLDGKNPGQYTLAAIEAVEPNVPWQADFLMIRKACYSATQNPKAERASRDLDEFLKLQTSFIDAVGLTTKIEKRDAKKNPEPDATARP